MVMNNWKWKKHSYGYQTCEPFKDAIITLSHYKGNRFGARIMYTDINNGLATDNSIIEAADWDEAKTMVPAALNKAIVKIMEESIRRCTNVIKLICLGS